MRESDIVHEIPDRVVPWLDTRAKKGALRTSDGVTLRHLVIPSTQERAAVVFVPGFHESLLKYSELFYDLRDDGLSIYTCDMRGQGFSDHLLPDPQTAWVARWEDWVEDLALFVEKVVMARPHARIFLVAHSMGGAVSSIYMARHPGVVAAAVLSAPDVKNRFPLPAVAAVRLLDLLGRGRDRIPGGKPYATTPFEKNKETHSVARHEAKMRYNEQHPEVCLGDPSVHFVVELVRLSAAARRAASALALPVLVLKAGDDSYVEPSALDAFCTALPDGRRAELDAARHEILIESDPVRDRAITEIRAFLATHSGQGRASARPV